MAAFAGGAWASRHPREASPSTALLVVFFEGTGNTIHPLTTQIGLFADACVAEDVTRSSEAPLEGSGPFKMKFDGCGVVNPVTGLLFAWGLDEQVEKVVQRAKQLLRPGVAANSRVRCVAVGLSRGGMACARLALAFAEETMLTENVDLSLLMFDPIPGDSVWLKFPFTGIRCKDLTECANLRDVLAIYPHEPLPAVAMHAPTLYAYPPNCVVEEDVTLGAHQLALYGTSRLPTDRVRLQQMVQDKSGSTASALASNLSFRRIADWLTERGVNLRFSSSVAQPSKQECAAICRAALCVSWSTQRSLHDATRRGRTIARHASGASFLNKHHERLEREIATDAAGGGGAGPGAFDSSGKPGARHRYLLEIVGS